MELPSLSSHTAIRQTGLWMTSLRNATPRAFSRAMSASRSSTSNAIVPPAVAPG